jgi:hypothetical protein
MNLAPHLLLMALAFQPADSQADADQRFATQLLRATLNRDFDTARKMSLPGVDFSVINGERTNKEQAERVETFITEQCKTKKIAGGDASLRLVILDVNRIDVPVPLHVDSGVVKADARWLVELLRRDQPSDANRVVSTFVAGLMTRNWQWLEQVSVPHDDLWVLSHGPELPGADRGILTEAAVKTPFVVLKAGERYVHQGKIAKVPDGARVAFGVSNTELLLPLVQRDSKWKVDPAPLIDRAAAVMTPEDRRTGLIEYRRKRKRVEAIELLRGNPDESQVDAFLKANKDQESKDVTFVLAARIVAQSSNGGKVDVKSGVYRSLKQLVDAGANPNALGEGGQTALHLACLSVMQEGDTTLIQHLLSLGADPGKKNDSGLTPLDYAFTPKVKQLIQEALKKKPESK